MCDQNYRSYGCFGGVMVHLMPLVLPFRYLLKTSSCFVFHVFGTGVCFWPCCFAWDQKYIFVSQKRDICGCCNCMILKKKTGSKAPGPLDLLVLEVGYVGHFPALLVRLVRETEVLSSLPTPTCSVCSVVNTVVLVQFFSAYFQNPHKKLQNNKKFISLHNAKITNCKIRDEFKDPALSKIQIKGESLWTVFGLSETHLHRYKYRYLLNSKEWKSFEWGKFQIKQAE